MTAEEEAEVGSKAGEERQDTEHVRDDATNGAGWPEEGGDQDCYPVGDDDVEDDAEEEAEAQRPLRDPGMPTKAEIAEHNLSHLPPRPWCPHCVRGKSRDSPSLRVAGKFAENLVLRVRLGYCFLTEGGDGEQGDADDDAEREAKVDAKQTILVMQESLCRSVWCYAVDKKGASEEWIVSRYARTWKR